MNRNQVSSPLPVLRPTPAVRPFTRAHNDLYDKVKPELYHKVDRSVLDALIRALEGFHQSWIAMTIPQLAHLAAVSTWSVTKALARLEELQVIIRRKRKLTKSGRFIWELALAESYRVTGAAAPTSTEGMGSSHGTLTWGEPMPCKENLVKKAVPMEHHHDETGAHDDDSSKSSEQTNSAASSPALVNDTPPALESAVRDESKPERTHTSEPSQILPAGKQPHPIFQASPPTASTPSADHAELREALQCLQSVGIDRWKARQLAQHCSLSLITQTVTGLRHRVGTIRNPAAWIIRELERGGYAPPPPLVQQEKRQAEQAAKIQQQREKAAHEAEQARLQQDHTARLLHHFTRLPGESQASLLLEVRERLRQVSPRLASAPLDLDSPGPLRSQLLELLEARLAHDWHTEGPTPRSGGWSQLRQTPAAHTSFG